MRCERSHGGTVATSLAALVMLCLPLGAALGQARPADQLRVLQSLPKEQRDELLRRAAGEGLDARGATADGRDDSIVVRRPPADEETSPLDSTEERKIKSEDQLLIEVVLSDEGATQTITEVTPDGRQVTRQTSATGAAVRSADEQRRLTEFRDGIMRRNPYALGRYGVLQLPGLEPIPLAGLTAQEAQERLALDPALRDFTIAVKVLRLDPQGARALKPFGYDTFRNGATAFVPGTDIPVPEDYAVGPGDVFEVQLYGQRSESLSLPVGRDGTLSVPDLGPINVGGLSFGAARGAVERRVRQQLVGTQARVSLSELRSMRVLVVGDAHKPGSYVVSGLSTVTNALFASGGVKPIGSLRRIEVKRAGQRLRTLDLYDVLLKGDTGNDVRLQSGDAVFIPPVGPTVTVDGEVRRPAIYELDEEDTAGELLAMAGGLTPEADDRRVTLERIGDLRERIAMTLDLSTDEGRSFVLRAGDSLRIAAIRPVLGNGVRVEGHVHRAGTYAWREGMRLSDLLGSVDELKPRADLHYVLIRREDPATRRVTALSADLGAAIAERGSSRDLPLAPRDTVTVFDLTSPRERILAPLLDEMARQGAPEAPSAVVTVGGRVNSQGRYPLEPGMRVADLVRAGGGLEDAAYGGHAELARYDIVSGERRRADLIEIDLRAALGGDAGANVVLQPYDVLTIKEMPDWGRVEQVEILGEVRFPGRYQIRRGETLRSVVERAGGLSPLAFAEGAALTRAELREREREQLERLANRMQSDLAALALQASQTNPTASQAFAAGQGLLDQLRQTRPVGRLVIDLPEILAPGARGASDVMLRDGDKLVVPRLAQEVSVLGEVQNPTSHLWTRGALRDDLVDLSGGYTSRADKKRAYVVRADGSVLASTSRWFGGGNVELEPGDTVVVPLDAEKMRPLPLWSAVTQIIYNLAIAAAAVNSF